MISLARVCDHPIRDSARRCRGRAAPSDSKPHIRKAAAGSVGSSTSETMPLTVDRFTAGSDTEYLSTAHVIEVATGRSRTFLPEDAVGRNRAFLPVDAYHGVPPRQYPL